MIEDISLEARLRGLTESFNVMGKNMAEMNRQLKTLTDYLAKVREFVNLPPMFPSDPEDGEYFFDEKTNSQYVFYVGEDEWDVNGWCEID